MEVGFTRKIRCRDKEARWTHTRTPTHKQANQMPTLSSHITHYPYHTRASPPHTHTHTHAHTHVRAQVWQLPAATRALLEVRLALRGRPEQERQQLFLLRGLMEWCIYPPQVGGGVRGGWGRVCMCVCVG